MTNPVAMTPDAGLDMISCSERAMRLTRAGCARMWRSANDPEQKPHPWEGRAACVACQGGARNAGVSPRTVKLRAAASLEQVCVRCLRPAERLIADLHCVSCYNRDREAARGANAKGGRPRLCDQLHAAAIAIIDHQGMRVARSDRVTGLIELMMTAARAAKGQLIFARPAPQHA